MKMFACLDYETDEWSESNLHLEIKFGMLCFYRNNKRKDILVRTAEETMKNIEKMYKLNKSPILVFAHNLDFDFKFLMKYVMEHYQFKIIDNGTIFSIKIFKRIHNKLKRICEFRNSLRLFPISLKKLGKALHFHKLKQDFTEETNPNFIRYCRRDCDIIMKGLKYLVKFFNDKGYPLQIEKMPLSFPSIAYKFFHFNNQEFQFKDVKYRIKNQLTNISNEINDYFRKFYFGGRTEVFDLNIFSKVAYLDFNSLYPSIMIHNKFPKPKYRKVKGYRPTWDTFAVFCTIDETREEIPLIAEKRDGKLGFFATIKESLITIEEYNYISDFRPNTIITIHELWKCDEWITPFEYMINLYEDRLQFKEDANPFEYFIKLLLNSTYGKFAERLEKREANFFKISEITSEKYRELLSKSVFDKIIDNTLITYSEKKLPYLAINVPFAHRITSLARLELVKMIDAIRKLGIKVIYSDTDSIVVESSNLDKLKTILDKKKLGMMKIEKEYTLFCALAPKEYLFLDKDEDGKIVKMQKAKGISEGTLADYYFNQVTTIRPIKFREAIKRNMDFKDAIKVIKHKQTFYDKRIVNNDLTTIPVKESFDFLESNKRIILNQMDVYEKYVSHFC